MSAMLKLDRQAYLEQERLSDTKHEYIDGEIFAMSGASPTHNLIVMNVGAALHRQFRNRPCRVYPSDLRVQVVDGYVYPDVTVVCGQPEFNDGDNLLNPSLIVEVLSPSTADYDAGGKFARYRQLSSLHDYVLIAQNKMSLMHYSRQDETHWLLSELQADSTSTSQTLILDRLECTLALADIYEKVFD